MRLRGCKRLEMRTPVYGVPTLGAHLGFPRTPGHNRAVRFALSTLLFAPRPLDTAWFPQIRALGYDGLVLWLTPPHLEPGRLPQIREAAAACGLEIVAVHLAPSANFDAWRRGEPLSVLDPNDERREEALCSGESGLDACESIGCGLAIMHLGGAVQSREPQAQTYAEEAIARISGHASPRGIELALENLGSELTQVPVLAESIEIVGRSMVGLCVDLGNAARTESIESALRATGRELVLVEATERDGSGQLAGELRRDARWQQAAALLEELRYGGWMCVELADPSLGSAPVDRLLEAAKSSLEALK